MKSKKNAYKENKLGIIVFIISIIICIASVSYAVWVQVYEGVKENQITTSTVVLNITEEKNAVNLINAVPVSDTTGYQYVPYTFNIKNSGTMDFDYTISLEDDIGSYVSDNCSNNKLDWSNIKFLITEKNETPIMNNLGDINGILKKGTIKGKTQKEFELRLWIKYDATNEIMGQHFHGRIKLESSQSNKNLDS